MNRANNMLLKTILPVVIGLAVVAWLFAREFSIEQFMQIPWTIRTIGAIILAWLCMAGREWGMMWRFRTLTDRDLSWRKAFKVTMLCEFTSAVTPTTAGGSALSMLFMKREGINLGRATALTMVTLMLDELFYVIACPLIFLLLPGGEIFGFNHSAFTVGVRTSFWIVYGGICAVTLFLFIGIFISPHRVAAALLKLFSIPWLRRWRGQVSELGDNLVATGKDIRHRTARWWCEAMAATCMTWVCRYLVVNALFWGFASAAPQAIVFARQFVVWTILTISPTPGGSGVSEWLFTNYYGDLIGDISIALILAIFWRIISYYIYLIAGAIMLPSWLRKGYTKHQHIK